MSEGSLVPDGIADLSWRVAGTGSFQAGGRDDVLWQNATSGKLVVWLMNGLARTTGLFTVPDGITDLNWQVVATGDFNADGKTDILFRNTSLGKLVVWTMDGVTRLSGAFTVPDGIADLNWEVAGTGDFNGDGKADLLWRHAVSGKFVTWFMDGLVRITGTFLVPESLTDGNWRVVSSRDLDGDGKSDLLWRHQVLGRLVVWWMDGIYRRTGGFTSPDGTAETGWTVVGPR